MELDVTHFKTLTQEEKQHRFNNKLCLYCGEAGHIVRSCPKKEKNSYKNNNNVDSGKGQARSM